MVNTSGDWSFAPHLEECIAALSGIAIGYIMTFEFIVILLCIVNIIVPPDDTITNVVA